MRVLVTGATGFVGSQLLEVLSARGIAVRALVRRTSDTALLERIGGERVEGGLDDRDALLRAVEGVDVVFHLAALTKARTVADYERTNVGGTERLLEAIQGARMRPRRLVYLSSLAAAGPIVDGRPVERDDPPRPLTTYGRTKLAGEAACLAAGGELEVVVLRPPAVYGPRDREILRFFRLAKLGVLPIPAGAEQRMQMVHVADLAEALVEAALSPAARGVYHVAEPRSYSWAEIAAIFGAAVGKRVHLVRVPAALIAAAARASEGGAALLGRTTIFNREKAEELLAPGWLCETDALAREVGFIPRIPLSEGLVQTATWYRAHGWL